MPLLCGLAAPLSAQTLSWLSLPPGYETFPGNGAMSLPARWSQGTMQVLYDAPLLPASLLGQLLQRTRLRRPAFLGEPAYGARSLTLKLSLGIPNRPAMFLEPDLTKNRPSAPPPTVVAGPVLYSIPATSPHGAAAAVAADLIDLPFAAPYAYPATSQGLFVEWETSSPALDISAGHWVDAIYSFAGNDKGGVFTTGNGGCGSATGVPMQLWPADASQPALGTPARLVLRRARPGSAAWVLTGPVDTDSVLPPLFAGLGFGGSLAPLGAPGCFLWTSHQGGALRTAVDVAGNADIAVPVPNDPLLKGKRLHLQVFSLDPGLNALGLAASNGLTLVPDELGLKGYCSAVLCPGPACTMSPWLAWGNSAPILLLGY